MPAVVQSLAQRVLHEPITVARAPAPDPSPIVTPFYPDPAASNEAAGLPRVPKAALAQERKAGSVAQAGRPTDGPKRKQPSKRGGASDRATDKKNKGSKGKAHGAHDTPGEAAPAPSNPGAPGSESGGPSSGKSGAPDTGSDDGGGSQGKGPKGGEGAPKPGGGASVGSHSVSSSDPSSTEPSKSKGRGGPDASRRAGAAAHGKSGPQAGSYDHSGPASKEK